jgi:hypothetical protein
LFITVTRKFVGVLCVFVRRFIQLDEFRVATNNGNVERDRSLPLRSDQPDPNAVLDNVGDISSPTTEAHRRSVRPFPAGDPLLQLVNCGAYH